MNALLDRLTPSCRNILAAASVQGQTFLAEVAAGVQGKEAGPVIRCLSEVLGSQHHLVEAGWRENHRGQSVSHFYFRHHLFQQFAYQQLDDVTRSRLREATGLALEALYSGQSEEHAAELARHFAAGGRAEKAARYFLTAGERAYLLSANETAITAFRKGLALLGTLPDTQDAAGLQRRAQQELALRMALGSPLRAGRGYAAAEVQDNHARVRDLARQLGDSDRQFIAELMLWTSYLAQADYKRALDASLQLHSLAQSTGKKSQIAEANLALGRAQLFLGQRNEGLANLQQGLSTCQEMGHYSNMTFGLALYAEAGSADGQREKVLQDALPLADFTGERFFAAELERLRGEHLLQSCNKPAAERCFQETLNIARRQEAKSLELRAATSLACLWQQPGRVQEARTLLAGVLGWFTEGLATADLQEANTLLEEL